ncbi:MAG TPA: Holliday junction branch migration protein RuvA [Gammaproteobacteria bacterium]|jgi:Holliday junction DNA helicase RuvA|nr:Holliday junction branch migration protein RuvA [Gammaproteobacteria bacterium]
MIGQLRGTLLEKQAPQLVLEVNGIGYEVDAPMSTFYQLPDVGAAVTLFTHLVVREDAHLLYGFYTRDERTLFRTLLKVNGVGPRMALTILSSVSPEGFVNAVLNNDTASLVRLPGVGKKTAERLVIEMRDKLDAWQQTPVLMGEGAVLAKPNQARHHILQDAIAALVSLGYKAPEASRMVTKIDDGNTNSEGLIRRALQEMA